MLDVMGGEPLIPLTKDQGNQDDRCDDRLYLASNDDGSQNYQYALRLLSNGMYAVTLAREEGTVVWRLVVARQDLKSLQLSNN
jgi:hypothetical protein